MGWTVEQANAALADANRVRNKAARLRRALRNEEKPAGLRLAADIIADPQPWQEAFTPAALITAPHKCGPALVNAVAKGTGVDVHRRLRDIPEADRARVAMSLHRRAAATEASKSKGVAA